MTTIFWLSIFFILYAYVGYPLLLWLLTSFRAGRMPDNSADSARFDSSVTLLISAYNEEEVIEKKILNSLAIDYPKELLEIVVVSDASRDNTDRIVERYADQGIVLNRHEGRIGKTECLNRAVPSAKGRIIVFSDANSLYDAHAVRGLVKHFGDPKIGFVTGSTRYISSLTGEPTAEPIGLYSRLEHLTKSFESKIGSCVGADGAIFAIRKNLYQALKQSDINDLVIPFTIIEQGHRGIFENGAFCLEPAAKNMSKEFERQIRITNRTIRAIVSHRILLNPLRFGIFSFELVSHKICKLFVPFFLILCLVSNLLVVNTSMVYAALLSVQVAFYILAVARAPLKGFSSLVSIPKTFAMTNCAIAIGWLKYLKGETFTTWGPSR
jgi:cellulose synthase/poly-beta-1,6-N-acetylglucosamine synthase-like glycosyltransferase